MLLILKGAGSGQQGLFLLANDLLQHTKIKVIEMVRLPHVASIALSQDEKYLVSWI